MHPIDDVLAVGALLSGIVISAGITGTDQDFYAISIDASWMMDDHTANEGPLYVGYATTDLSVTEIKEGIEAQPRSMSDRIAKEQAGRPIRKVGGFAGRQPNEDLNDGISKRTKLGFVLAESMEVSMWAKNMDPNTLTTGTLIRIQGNLYGRWL